MFIEYGKPECCIIDNGLMQSERLIRLNKIAIQQMRVLEDGAERMLLK